MTQNKKAFLVEAIVTTTDQVHNVKGIILSRRKNPRPKAIRKIMKAFACEEDDIQSLNLHKLKLLSKHI